MHVKYEEIEALAMKHLTRKTALYQGDYTKMSRQWSPSEANDAIREMAETLQMAGYAVRKYQTVAFPRNWHAVIK